MSAPNIVGLLLFGDHSGDDGVTPLIAATRGEHIGVVVMLITNGAEFKVAD